MLRLEKPTPVHQVRYEAMMDEWEAQGGRINPGALRRYSSATQQKVSYERWLQWIVQDADAATCPQGSVPQQLYFLLEGERLLGAISIRPFLTPDYLQWAGHMGYGIRPAERRRGYAAKMLALALPLAKRCGIEKLLLVCDKDNLASAKTIQKNGGVLENELTEDDGNVIQRYWIDLEESQ